MRRKYLRKIVWTIVLSIALAASFVLCYSPFVQLKDIDAEEYLGGYLDDSWNDRTLELRLRFQLYPSCWFIHKGDKYTDIPFLDEDSVSRKMDIKFNWDNSVTISEDTVKYDLQIQRVVISPQIYPRSFNNNDQLRYIGQYDSLFVGVFMFDSTNTNGIAVYRQKESMPFGGKRVGFRITIDGKVCVTGAKEYFNY